MTDEQLARVEAMRLTPKMAPIDSPVRLAAPSDALPMLLAGYAGRVGTVVRWLECGMVLVRFGWRQLIVAPMHLSTLEPQRNGDA